MKDVRAQTLVDLGTGMNIERIVVPITLDHRFDRGVSYAARLAERWGFPVRLVSIDVGAEDAVSLDLGAAIEASRSAFAAGHPGVDVSDEIIAAGDDAAAAMAQVLARTDLVVMATEAAGTGDRTSSFAQALAHEWGGPIVMIGPHAAIDRLDGDVVVGVDGSVLGERGLPVATGIARAFGVHTWVVQAVPAAVTEHVERLKGRGERVSENAYVRDVVQRYGGTVASWEVVHADEAASALVEFVHDRNAALLVLATHGETALPRPVFGSVCMDAVRRSTRPVVVIRPEDVATELTLR